MNIVTDLNEWRAKRASFIGKSIGFVPTMGHLHAGHLSLCERSCAENEVTVVSVFVNPTQFNQASDFECYPRTLEADAALLKQLPVQYLLAPESQALYPDGYEVQVSETILSRLLEGEYRPGHFTGMLTVVLKLLNIVQPTRLYMGEKDYQQLLLVQKMVASLMLPIEVIGCPTVRAEDGLALSSRNSRLTPAQRKQAAHLPRLLQSALSADAVKQELTQLGFKVDYISEQWNRRLAAVWLDEVRLIDNVELM